MANSAEIAQRRFPGRAVAFEGEGQLSSAWRVDDELVVRVPRHAFGVDRLRFEVELLAVIRTKLTTPVPEIVEAELDLPVGSAYVVHRRIAGHVLKRDHVPAFTRDRVHRLGAQIGQFLHELHAISPADLGVVPVRSAARFAADLRKEVKTLLRPLIEAEQVATALATLDELATLPATPLVLAHTDIGGNIVVDDDDRVGVIDFGSCFVTHPAFDAASLSALGDDLVRAAAAEYPLLGDLGDESRIVASTFALQDALYGARQDDWEHVRTVFGPVT